MAELYEKISKTLNQTLTDLNSVWADIGVDAEERDRELKKLLNDTLSLFYKVTEVMKNAL
jgi:hypothetical protein